MKYRFQSVLMFCFYRHIIYLPFNNICNVLAKRGYRGRDRMVVGFTTSYAISAYHYYRCEFESRSWRDVLIQHYVINVVSDL